MKDFANSVLISNRIDTDQFCQEKKNYLENQPSSKFYSENMFQKRTKKLLFILIIILICVSLVKNLFSNQAYYKTHGKIFQNLEKCENTTIMLDDYSNGDLQNIYSKIQKYQYIFIYLYSHWDAKSLLYKSLFSQLACEFRHKIKFQAVNCFYGECRDHFKLIKYPHLLINIKDVGTYSYKGAFEYFYLKNYLSIIQKPLRIIETFEDLFKFITKNDNVLIGNFDFNSKIENDYFMTFYKSSLHSIHSDFESPIGYGVVLNQTLLDKLQLHIDLKKRHKIMFFSSFGFKNSLLNLKNANVDNLDKWIRRSINKSIDWLYPDKYQIKSDKNRLMIFIERENIYNQEIRNEKFYSTVKYLILKSSQSCGFIQKSTHFFKQYIEYLENNFIRDTCLQNNPILANLKADHSNSINSNLICTFQENINIFFVDFKLYSNYAVQLLGQNFIDKKSELPLVLLVDNKNQSVFKLSGHFSFENLYQFFQNQTYYKNTQVKRMRKTLGEHSKRLKNLLEIDSRELEDFSKFRDKDVLVFYFNNWCGFCNLVNYYLLDIAQKYFSNIDSFLMLKIDVDSNDLKWEQTFNHLPTLVFIPAFWQNKKESILYNYGNEFGKHTILKFILTHSKNPKTISDFLSNNFLKSRNLSNLFIESKKSSIMIEKISKKIEKLESDVKLLKEKSIFFNTSHSSCKEFKNIYHKTLKTHIYQIDLLKSFLLKN